MNFYKKEKKSVNGYRLSSISIIGIKVFSVKKSFFEKKITLFGIPVRFRRNKIQASSNEKFFYDVDTFSGALKDKLDYYAGNCILWFDSSLGGGTEVYSQTQFRLLKNKCILRVQYNHNYDCFRLSIPDCGETYIYSKESFFDFLLDTKYSEICVNNLVGWKDCPHVLNFISSYKDKESDTIVSFRCHDFYSICPSYNLLNSKGAFCRLSNKEGCQKCIESFIYNRFIRFNSAFISCGCDIEQWRIMWRGFFRQTVDEIIAFSNSTKDLFLEVYPEISEKIFIIPHVVKTLTKAEVKKHSGINIAFLGNMNLYQKGSEIIRGLVLNNLDPDIHFLVIGSFDNAPKNIVVTGKYNTKDLPEIIKKYSIDVIFISSIWPETFSYTTSEAISTGVFLVCYDFGAQAERISMYNKGLVLREISYRNNLNEIKEFVLKIRD